MSDSQTLGGCWLPVSGCRFPAFRRLWPGITVCALCAGYAHILARLRNPLQGFCPSKEGGLGFSSRSTEDTKASPVTLTL